MAGVVAVDYAENVSMEVGYCGLFIDCRDLGIEIAFNRFPTCLLTVDDVCGAIGAEIPPDFDGYDHRASQPGTFRFRNGALVTVWLDLDCELRSSSSDGQGPGDDSMGAEPDDAGSHRRPGGGSEGSSDERGRGTHHGREPDADSPRSGRSRSPRRGRDDVVDEGFACCAGVVLPLRERDEADIWKGGLRDDAILDRIHADTSGYLCPALLRTTLETADRRVSVGLLQKVVDVLHLVEHGVECEAVNSRRPDAVPTMLFLEDLIFPALRIQQSCEPAAEFCRVGAALVAWSDDKDHDFWKFVPYAALGDFCGEVARRDRFATWLMGGSGRVLLPLHSCDSRGVLSSSVIVSRRFGELAAMGL